MIGSPSQILAGTASVLSNTLGVNNVTIDDYEILARRSPVCAIVSLAHGLITPHQLQEMGAVWTIQVTLYFQTRPTGGAPLRSLPQTILQVCDALITHQTLSDTVRQIASIEVIHTPGAAVEANGLVWLTVEIRIDARVF